MKILFGSIDNENPNGKRGIHSIVKPMVIASKSMGNENGIIGGVPLYLVDNNSPLLQSKLQHLYMHRYLQDGYATNSSLLPSKSRIQKIRRIKHYLMTALLNKSLVIDVDKFAMPDIKSSWLTDFSFFASIPFFYTRHNRGKIRSTAGSLGKIVKTQNIDIVLMGWPTSLRKGDVKGAKLVHFIHDSMYIDIESEPIHNSIPIKFAEDFYSACCESDIVLVNSNDTKNKVLSVNPAVKVSVLYGVAPIAKVSESTNALVGMGLQSKGYFLFVSSMEKRKNVLGILRAFLNIIDKTDKNMVFVGSEGYEFSEVRELHNSLPKEIKDRILFTGYVSEEAKNQLYSHASIYLAPSLYEGLGLGPVEAMSYGVPVIISRKGGMPEVGGDAALYIEDPHDIVELSQKILQLESDDGLRSSLIELGYERARFFTQEKFNKRFHDAIEGLKVDNR